MSKYIDADKLIAEIERRKKQDITFRERSILIDIETVITPLQQEQPEVELEEELDKFYGMYRDENGMAYDCETNLRCLDWKDDEDEDQKLPIARHFYELGLNARKEE